MEMKFAAAALYLLFGTVTVEGKFSMVELSSEWKPNFGWEVVCLWNLFANDSLQSVRLSKSYQQFLIYRPEIDASKRTALMRLPTMELQADCYETYTNGVTGKCVLSLEILQPVREDMNFTCEVSGERPTFRFDTKTVNIEALVPPTDAVVEQIGQNDQYSGRVSVNCTSSGLPAPNLLWTIGDQKVPQDFSGKAWNFTSKLYHVWSSLSYIPADSNSHALCTPEIVRAGHVVRGQAGQHSAACVMKGGCVNHIPVPSPHSGINEMNSIET